MPRTALAQQHCFHLFFSLWFCTLLHSYRSTGLCIKNDIVRSLVVGIQPQSQPLRKSMLGSWLLSILHCTVLGGSTSGCARGGGPKGLAEVMVRGAPHVANGGCPPHAAAQAPASFQTTQPHATTTNSSFTANEATADCATASNYPGWATNSSYVRARDNPLCHNHIVGIG